MVTASHSQLKAISQTSLSYLPRRASHSLLADKPSRSSLQRPASNFWFVAIAVPEVLITSVFTVSHSQLIANSQTSLTVAPYHVQPSILNS
jgi:hypothetical protein